MPPVKALMEDHMHYLNRLGRLVNERKAKRTCKPQEKIKIGFSSETARNNRTKKSVLVHKSIILTEKILNQIKQDFDKSCQI